MGASSMRILWLTDWQPQAVRQKLELGDFPGPQAWVDSLAAVLQTRPGVSLAVASPSAQHFAPFERDGVQYFALPFTTPIGRIGRIVDGWRHRLPSPSAMVAAGDLIRRYRPDIVHVHGTEGGLGLITALAAPTPCVISLQGILRAYERMYFAGRVPGEIASLVLSAEFLKGRGVVHRYLVLRRQAEREVRIMRGARWFIGRTQWDREMLRAVNSSAIYYHCDEIMRPEFYSANWSRHRHEERAFI
ncbi:MAG: hypothetical protein ACLQUT_08920 [Thermoleophilia bacterium]